LSASAGTLDAIEVTRDNEKVLEATNAENSAFLKDYEMTASFWGFPVVFDTDQQVSSALIVNKELNVRVLSSAPNALTALVEHRVPGYV
jgi:hypothetical protein